MRDEDRREVPFFTEAHEEVYDLRLDRDVKRRDRLVAHHHIRLHRERTCDRGALPLTHTFDAKTELGAFNNRCFSNPALDKLIEAAGVEIDAAKREQELKHANALVASDRPNLGIASVITAWGLGKKLTIVPRSDEDTLAMNIRPAN